MLRLKRELQARIAENKVIIAEKREQSYMIDKVLIKSLDVLKLIKDDRKACEAYSYIEKALNERQMKLMEEVEGAEEANTLLEKQLDSLH